MTSNPPPSTNNASTNLTTLVAAVGEDPELTPLEKETIIKWSKGDREATIFTDTGSLTRRLLRHPLFETEWIRVNTANAWGRKMSLTEYSQGRITAINGQFPIGAVKLQSASRSDSAICKVISKDGLRDL